MDMEKIVMTARELGKLVKDTDEFKRLTLAQMAQEMDLSLQNKMKEFNETRDKLVDAMGNGKNDSPEVKALDEKLSALFNEIKENEKMQELESASGSFDTIMKMVYDVLQLEITGQPPQSCGSDCSSCAGCH